jgi:hypothetical protein
MDYWYISHLWVGGHWMNPTNTWIWATQQGKYGCYECNEELHIVCRRHPLLGNDSIPTFKGKGHARQNNCWQCICDLYFLYIIIIIIFLFKIFFYTNMAWLLQLRKCKRNSTAMNPNTWDPTTRCKIICYHTNRRT